MANNQRSQNLSHPSLLCMNFQRSLQHMTLSHQSINFQKKKKLEHKPPSDELPNKPPMYKPTPSIHEPLKKPPMYKHKPPLHEFPKKPPIHEPKPPKLPVHEPPKKEKPEHKPPIYEPPKKPPIHEPLKKPPAYKPKSPVHEPPKKEKSKPKSPVHEPPKKPPMHEFKPPKPPIHLQRKRNQNPSHQFMNLQKNHLMVTIQVTLHWRSSPHLAIRRTEPLLWLCR
ncbi:hypothetical protein ES288_D10G184300v1 [Gossypium darwinii]|uniref:Uncharacterized protein n=1 Tax=Gossypium darwinii TaxID=34276 RepID=A0A5D2B1V8_GOSDA|nr:hypothetical protein ES288_D10G184300v1 [Gossypium darwinii]